MFTRYYQPQKDICVDETLVGTRGRTAMLQYIPSKHSKFGVKFWVLAESATGYIVRMSCYLGKKFQPVTSGVCQETSVVLDLLRESELLGRGYHVFAIIFSLLSNLPRLCCAWEHFLLSQLDLTDEFHLQSRKQMYCQGIQSSCAKDVYFLLPTREWRGNDLCASYQQPFHLTYLVVFLQ